jgi:FMN phosphatase YigB (HAD superfamily)
VTAIRAVVLDVGETLVDETEAWGDWADWLGVPRLTLFAALGAVIARGAPFREVFEVIRPGIDLAAEIEARRIAGRRPGVTADDLYPDAVPCLRTLLDAGYAVGIAANQPTTTEAVFAALDLPLALVVSSETWGVAKPDPAFFGRICEALDMSPAEIAYVGDRLDNDIVPAVAAGMTAIFIRRGPWGFIQEGMDARAPGGAAAVIDGLDELPGVLSALAGAS